MCARDALFFFLWFFPSTQNEIFEISTSTRFLIRRIQSRNCILARRNCRRQKYKNSPKLTAWLQLPSPSLQLNLVLVTIAILRKKFRKIPIAPWGDEIEAGRSVGTWVNHIAEFRPFRRIVTRPGMSYGSRCNETVRI